MNGFELIIFDCDGVLVDSERIANEVFSKILNEEYGLSFAIEDMFEMFMGHSSSQCMKIIRDKLGYEPSELVEERYKTEINAALTKDVVAVKGIEKALEDISVPFCVASSGSYEKMCTTLKKTNLMEKFEGNLFSTSDVKNGKPFPDIYLHAAKGMGNVPADKCLVVEDSPSGIKGAVAASMTAFGYAELTKESRLIEAGAHHLFKNMGNLAYEIMSYERKTRAPY